jgi:hypothetical protein
MKPTPTKMFSVGACWMLALLMFVAHIAEDRNSWVGWAFLGFFLLLQGSAMSLAHEWEADRD